MIMQVDLSRMCYRDSNQGIWQKPVGTGQFTFNITELKLTYWFKDLKGKITVWGRKNYNKDNKDGNFLYWLKNNEADILEWFHARDNGPGDFHLASNNEYT